MDRVTAAFANQVVLAGWGTDSAFAAPVFQGDVRGARRALTYSAQPLSPRGPVPESQRAVAES
jgi:hypothetical protein